MRHGSRGNRGETLDDGGQPGISRTVVRRCADPPFNEQRLERPPKGGTVGRARVRTLFHLTSFVLLGLGALAVVSGLFWLAYALITPAQPRPSLNEGPALAGVAGLFFVMTGAASVFVGLLISAGLKASRPVDELVSPEWAREHKRWW